MDCIVEAASKENCFDVKVLDMLGFPARKQVNYTLLPRDGSKADSRPALLSGSFTSPSLAIDLSKLASGAYTLRFTIEGADSTATATADFTLYRRTLAAQPDCSVTVLSLGFATELAKLLDSPADDISPLTGRELVARKVKTLSIMAGSYGEKQRAEFNVVNDIPAMRKLFAEWDTPIVQNPFELGKQVMYPGAAIENDFGWAKLHPVVEGYKNYHKMPYDRASWDLLSVVYLLHPEYFTESEPGTVAVDDKGFTNFTPGPDGRHRWLTATPEQLTRLRDCIVRTTTRAPKHTEL